MFRCADVADFKAEVVNVGDLDEFVLSIEVSPDNDPATVAKSVAQRTKLKFELTPQIRLLERGTLAREFENAVKAPRFADRRRP